jgi:hypothetical protein
MTPTAIVLLLLTLLVATDTDGNSDDTHQP